jgi:hypothetical protein
VAVQTGLAFCGHLNASNCNQREKKKTDKSYKAHGSLRSKNILIAIMSSATLVPVAEELHQQRHHDWEPGRIGSVQFGLSGREPVQ